MSQALLAASSKLQKVYPQEQTLSKERQPGGALALTPEEQASSRKRSSGEMERHGQELKTTGELRMPEMQAKAQELGRQMQNQEAAERLRGEPQTGVPDVHSDIKKNLEAAGRGSEKTTLGAAGVYRRITEDLGVEETGSPLDSAPFSVAVLKAAEAIDPTGTLTEKIADELRVIFSKERSQQPATQEAAPAKDQQGEAMAGEIREKQAMRRQSASGVSLRAACRMSTATSRRTLRLLGGGARRRRWALPGCTGASRRILA